MVAGSSRLQIWQHNFVACTTKGWFDGVYTAIRNRKFPYRFNPVLITSDPNEFGEKLDLYCLCQEPKENMNFIMSNEYMKLWFKERENYEKQNYAQQQMNTTEQLKRRTVQRLMNCEKAPHRRIPVNKFINNNNEKCVLLINDIIIIRWLIDNNYAFRLSNTPSKETKNIGITVNRYKIECGSSSHTNNNRIRNN